MLYNMLEQTLVYVDDERLESFMSEVTIIQKTVNWFAEQTNGLVTNDKNLLHERINALVLACFIEIYFLIMTK